MSQDHTAIKSLDEVKKLFDENGVSVARWAKNKGFSVPLVYSVLNGRNPARRGESFKIGVALGLRPAPKNTELFEGMHSPSLGFGTFNLTPGGHNL
jgi:gp16 family phage-associated protein